MANPIDLLKDFAGKFAGIEESLTKLVTAEGRVKSLESDLSTAKQTISTLSAELEKEKGDHVATKSALEKAQSEVNASGTQILTLTAAVEAEKTRANVVIASQGLPSDKLPTASVTNGAATTNTAPALDPKLKGSARLLSAFSKKS